MGLEKTVRVHDDLGLVDEDAVDIDVPGGKGASEERPDADRRDAAARPRHGTGEVQGAAACRAEVCERSAVRIDIDREAGDLRGLRQCQHRAMRERDRDA